MLPKQQILIARGNAQIFEQVYPFLYLDTNYNLASSLFTRTKSVVHNCWNENLFEKQRNK